MTLGNTQILISTGEMAELCQTTKKTLRYYHKVGVLVPHKIEKSFRYYVPEQVILFQKIRLLQKFGFSLDEIRVVLDKGDFLSVLKEKVSELKGRKHQLEILIEKGEEYVTNFQKKEIIIKPSIKLIDPMYFYYIERVGRYVDIADFNRELSNYIGDKNFERKYMTIFLDDGFTPSGSRMRVCALRDRNESNLYLNVKSGEMDSHKVVSYIHVGSYDVLSYIWKELERIVQVEGFKIDKRFECREIYHYGKLYDPGKDNEYVTELQIGVVSE